MTVVKAAEIDLVEGLWTIEYSLSGWEELAEYKFEVALFEGVIWLSIPLYYQLSQHLVSKRLLERHEQQLLRVLVLKNSDFGIKKTSLKKDMKRIPNFTKEITYSSSIKVGLS